MVNRIGFNVSNKVLVVLGVAGSILVFGGFFVGFKIAPDTITNKLWETKILKENTQQWDIFVETPFPFTFKVYVYDVKNPDEILQGEKPVVQEVGPFVYKLFKWKKEIDWTTPDDISYNLYNRYHFDKDASGLYSDETEVTIFNTMYYSILLRIGEIQPEAFSLIENELPAIFGKNDGMFIKVKVKDYLFEGLKFCENGGADGGFAASMVCKQVTEKLHESRNLRLANKTILFANMHYKNNTHLGRFTVKSGQKNREESGILSLYDGKEYINAWAGDKSICNKIRGVTTVFPVGVRTNMIFESFAEDICRTVALEYSSEETVKTLQGLKFVAKNDTFSGSTKENSCFCQNKTHTFNTDLGCVKDGIMDLSNCTGGPVMVSFPHLLYGDKEYQTSVQGMEPNKSTHETFLVLEPVTGLPLYAAQRIQFNMFLRPVEGMESLANVSKALMPLLWIEESLLIGDEYIGMIKSQVFHTINIINIVTWTVIVLGAFCLMTAILVVIYRQAP